MTTLITEKQLKTLGFKKEPTTIDDELVYDVFKMNKNGFEIEVINEYTNTMRCTKQYVQVDEKTAKGVLDMLDLNFLVNLL